MDDTPPTHGRLERLPSPPPETAERWNRHLLEGITIDPTCPPGYALLSFGSDAESAVAVVHTTPTEVVGHGVGRERLRDDVLGAQ